MSQNIQDTTVNRMANAIAAIGSEQGFCRRTDLHTAGFTRAEIDAHGHTAMELASDIVARRIRSAAKKDTVHRAPVPELGDYQR